MSFDFNSKQLYIYAIKTMDILLKLRESMSKLNYLKYE
jgi:hypothetical protein